MSVGLFFPKLPSCTKTYQLAFNIYSLPIVFIYNQLDVITYQQHISTIYHQQVITTMNTKNTRCMYNFFLLRTTILGVYQQQLNRVQLYKSTISICKTQLTFSAPTEMRQQSSIDINMSTGTRPVSSATRVCMCPGSLQPMCERSQCIMQQAYASEQLGFSFLHMLRSSASCNHFLFCLPLSKLTHNQSQYIQALQQLAHAPQQINMNAISIMFKQLVYHSNHVTTESQECCSLHQPNQPN